MPIPGCFGKTSPSPSHQGQVTELIKLCRICLGQFDLSLQLIMAVTRISRTVEGQVILGRTAQLLSQSGSRGECLPKGSGQLIPHLAAPVHGFSCCFIKLYLCVNFVTSHPSPSSQAMERGVELAGAGPSQQSCSGHSVHRDLALAIPVPFLTGGCAGVKFLTTILGYFKKKNPNVVRCLSPHSIAQAEGCRSGWCWWPVLSLWCGCDR